MTNYLLLALLLADLVSAAPTPSVSLLILSKTDRTVAIVDQTNLKVVAREPVGPDPHLVVSGEPDLLADECQTVRPAQRAKDR